MNLRGFGLDRIGPDETIEDHLRNQLWNGGKMWALSFSPPRFAARVGAEVVTIPGFTAFGP